MTKQSLINEILSETGLNWAVEKNPIYDVAANPIENFTAITRQDTGEVFGMSKGGGYEILQNEAMVETLVESVSEVDKDTDIVHPWNNSDTLGSVGSFGGGSLKGGAKVFAQCFLPDTYIGKSGVKRYLTILNSHDLTASVAFGFGNQVVCCENTFEMATSELSKIRHTASMAVRIEDAVKSFKKVLKREDQVLDAYDKATRVDLNKSMVQNWVKELFIKDMQKTKEKGVSTRTQNQITSFVQAVDQSIDEQGGNLYALFNGVTRYTNHVVKSSDKAYGLRFGIESKLNDKALTMLELELV